MTRWFYVSCGITLLALAASGYYAFVAYDSLLARMPTHWNLHGAPDGWTRKEDAAPIFFLLPAVLIGLQALTLALPWLSPKQFQVRSFLGAYGLVMALTTGLLAYIHLVTLVGSARPGSLDVGRWLIGGLMAFFAAIGWLMPRIERNFWMGVRTPWTLASETVWRATHRLAGWTFGIAGALGVICLLAGGRLEICFVLVMVAALAPVVYSLVYYKWLERRGEV
jgi:uncharacterized membrane protein